MKPDNILFDEDGNALITDFGIATARFHGRLTASGRAMGTPHYMSPEQAMGKLVDGRSDLYALGVVMYEALVGFPPFDGADAFSVGYKHVHEKPVPISRDRLARAGAARGDRDALSGEVGGRPLRARHRARRRADRLPRRRGRRHAVAPQAILARIRTPIAPRMKLSHEIIALRTTHPFVIARGGSSEYRVVRVTVTDDDGATGWGEAAPSKHYGETADTVVGALPVLAAVLEGADGWSLEAIEHAMAKAMRFNGSARVGGERGAARSRGEAARRAAVPDVGARSGGVAADELHDRHRARRGDAARSACAEAAQLSGAQDQARHELGRADRARRARDGADEGAARRRERGVDAEVRAAR